MTPSELRDRILALPVGVSGAFRSCPKERNRWHLVQALLNSIQAETSASHGETNGASPTAESSASEKETKAPKPGLNRGAMVMSADFDDPLELCGFLPQRVDPLAFQQEIREEWNK
ncbi:MULTISPECIES: hypothetical protein [unclassified Roseofilum]|uniref:hypothetical protein n=1 Tax=unclassified Roseofilum TaxID=2620099 RepID=UPI001B1E6328|nr:MULTISPECIES: hypothetical protein [unclassified Roseofilum]MBP0010830.1 hypothetical protein [Roseofilum sp. Belize Diploria]MBP0035295.1 hypothetical protein [Roseofilum sp. Belize BBD 4]